MRYVTNYETKDGQTRAVAESQAEEKQNGREVRDKKENAKQEDK